MRFPTSTKLSAYLLIATGILHNTIGLIFGAGVLADIVRAGLFNTISPPNYDREAIFWFLFAGFAMMLWGALLFHLTHVPKVFGISLLALCILGVIMMPASGFWLVIPQAIYMLLQPTKKAHLRMHSQPST
ncbi:MAG: DUF6463 family protein [Deinococcota bacterium]